MMDDAEPRFHVRFAEETKKELRKLGHAAAAAVLHAAQTKLTRDPEGYGQPLRKNLKGYFKLVIAQWRAVYHIDKERVTVLVLAVGKRAAGDWENVYDRVSHENLTERQRRLQREMDSTRGRGGDG